MKSLIQFLALLCSLLWAGIQTWWTFLGESGVEADDPDKEREVL